jgi:hypothetical protein
MLVFEKSLEEIKRGDNPFKKNIYSFKEITLFYLQSINSDIESGPYITKALEEYFDTKLLSEEIGSFEDFFKLASLFDRDKNSVNRYFDSALGLYTPASETKLVQIAFEKKNKEQDLSMRVRGSFEYSHTQTHYTDLMDLFNYLDPAPGESFIDIGSGFGRVGFFIGLCFPKISYRGFELIKERVLCSNSIKERNHFDNIDFFEQNLLDPNFKLPVSDYYFLYDPLEKEDLELFFGSLTIVPGQKIIAFEGYDDYILAFLNELSWLRLTKSFQDEYFSIKGAIFEVK